MKAVILAGGLGTRLAEETEIRPKPMVEVGDRPLLWHIMKHYASFGVCEFVIALGYKGEVIKRFFLEYGPLASDLTVSLKDLSVTTRAAEREPWLVHLVDTGVDTETGGRVGRVRDFLEGETFCLTYGDGLSDLDVDALLAFHRAHGRAVTITAVHPPARFGALTFGEGRPAHFTEKHHADGGWINGGFMVVEPSVLDEIHGDATSLETDVLEHLALAGDLMAFPHEGFWQCADTLRDVRLLRSLWTSGRAPWVTW